MTEGTLPFLGEFLHAVSSPGMGAMENIRFYVDLNFCHEFLILW